MSTFHVRLVAPTGPLFDGEAESLIAPGQLGSFGILANHAPMISALKPGILTIRTPSTTSYFVLGTGVLEVFSGQVSVLADQAETAQNAEDGLARLRASAAAAEPRKRK